MLNAERRIDNDEKYRMMVIEYMEGGRIDLVISQSYRRAVQTDSLMFRLLNGKESCCCVAVACCFSVRFSFRSRCPSRKSRRAGRNYRRRNRRTGKCPKARKYSAEKVQS